MQTVAYLIHKGHIITNLSEQAKWQPLSTVQDEATSIEQ